MVSSKDYVFRYKLEAGKKRPPVRDPLTEMIRAQLENLLNLVVPVCGEEEVKVDGFKLLNDPKTIHPVFQGNANYEEETPVSKTTSFQDLRNAALYEPRIELIRKQLDSIFTVVDLERGGVVVEVESFRLRNLRDWLVPSEGDPIEVFGYAASRCNANCIFCYNRGNPPSVALGVLRRLPEEELEEMVTRLRYFSPRAGRCLFSSLGEGYEVLMHPYALKVLRLLREKTGRVFRITTSGMNMKPELMAELAKLKPIYLYLSLNSASLGRHRELMRGQNSRVPLGAPPLLREREIPYAVVVVPWPVNGLGEMLEDLEKTIYYANEHEAHLVQVNLPGYSKHFSSERLFDLDEVWSAVVTLVRRLRGMISLPIVVMPSMYEENLYESRVNLPRVIGLVKNSPAVNSGLRRGDLLLEIDGLRVSTRPQARDILSVLSESGKEEAHLLIEREGRSLNIALKLKEASYPYSEEIDRHLGVVLMGTGFRLSYLERLKELIDSRGAKRILFLSSALVRPVFEQGLRESRLFADRELRVDIEVPRNNFFGGVIFMGDLLVVADFIDCIENYLARGNPRPDLIVIPASPFNLGQWKRDLTGRVYLDIERKVGIPVELLECGTIYD